MKKVFFLFISQLVLISCFFLIGANEALAQGRGSSSLNDAFLGEQVLDDASWPSLVSVKAVDGSHDLTLNNGKLSKLYYGKKYEITCIDEKYELVKIVTSWDNAEIEAKDNSAVFVASNEGSWMTRLIDVYFKPKSDEPVAKRFTVKVASSQGLPFDKPLFDGETVNVADDGFSATIEEGKEMTLTVYSLNHEAQTVGQNHVLTYISADGQNFDLPPFTKSKELKLTVTSDVEVRLEQQKTEWITIKKVGEGTISVTGTKDNKAEGRVLITPNKELTFDPQPAEGYVLKSVIMDFADTGMFIDLTEKLKVEAEAGVSFTVTFEKKNSTAIEGLEAPAVSVCSNPVAGKLSIKGLQANASVKLFSLAGTLLLETKCDAQGCATFQGLQTLTKGVYILKSASWSEKIQIK